MRCCLSGDWLSQGRGSLSGQNGTGRLPEEGGAGGAFAVELGDTVGRRWDLSGAPLNSLLAESRMTASLSLPGLVVRLQALAPGANPGIGGWVKQWRYPKSQQEPWPRLPRPLLSLIPKPYGTGAEGCLPSFLCVSTKTCRRMALGGSRGSGHG